MTDIHLRFDLTAINEIATIRWLTARAYGRRFAIAVIASAAMTWIVGAWLCLRYTGLDVFSPTGVAAVYLMVFSLIPPILIRRYYRNSVLRRQVAAPFRQQVIDIRLSADGIDRGGAHFPWSFITDMVTALPGRTLLLLSPTECITLPHAGLQDGMTAEDLHDKIATWRTA